MNPAKNPLKKPHYFFSFGHYRRFSWWWWNDLCHYLIGISYDFNASELGRRPIWGSVPGWCYDLYTFYHRGRYGWAPRDVWNLDYYYNRVMAGSLEHLANTTHGHPPNYRGDGDDMDGTIAAANWDSDLRKWANAFSEDPSDVDIYDREDGYKAHLAEETRRREAIHQALKEMEPYWEHLWD